MSAVATRALPVRTLVFVAAMFVALVVFERWLGFRFLASDAAGYWATSQDPATLHPYHLPAYPLLLAAGRFLTFGTMPPVVLMLAFTACAVLAGCWCAGKLAGIPLNRSWVPAGALLFALWPFVGLSYAVYPIADSVACALFVCGSLAYATRRLGLAGLAFGFAAVTHKGLWIPIAIVAMWTLVSRGREGRTAFALLVAAPLVVVYLAGVSQFGNPAWIVEANLRNEVVGPSEGFRPFQGLVTSLVNGGAATIKGLVVIAMAAIASAVIWAARKLQADLRPLAIAAGVAVLVYAAVLNEHELWATVRFSKILAVPVVWTFGTPGWSHVWAGLPGHVAVFLLTASQAVYGTYIVRVLER